jgi:PE family
MSSLNIAPDIVAAASGNLENLGSALRSANAAAASQTTAIAAPAADEVSAAITALFGAHAQQFHALTTKAAAFNDEFVNLLDGGAAQYVSTELTNAQQTLVNAVNAPAQALLGHPLIGTSQGTAAAANPASFLDTLNSYENQAVTGVKNFVTGQLKDFAQGVILSSYAGIDISGPSFNVNAWGYDGIQITATGGVALHAYSPLEQLLFGKPNLPPVQLFSFTATAATDTFGGFASVRETLPFGTVGVSMTEGPDGLWASFQFPFDTGFSFGTPYVPPHAAR